MYNEYALHVYNLEFRNQSLGLQCYNIAQGSHGVNERLDITWDIRWNHNATPTSV